MSCSCWIQNLNGSFHRPFGASEYAFFPPSTDGTGDMFLHLAFSAPSSFLRQSRVILAWAIIRQRHPLLASNVTTDENGYPHFQLKIPKSSAIAAQEAKESVLFKTERKDELISAFLNGPRLLSNENLSFLVISSSNDQLENGDVLECDLLMCAPHFAGDGSSLHQSAHDILSLLASSTDEQLYNALEVSPTLKDLPPAFESRCPQPQGRLVEAVSRTNFCKKIDSEIGGHTFPRFRRGSRNSIIVERGFTEVQTKSILQKCKANDVTINNVLYVLCNAVWADMATRETFKNPVMMYTAINMRSYIEPCSASTYWFLALTYFNVVLPSFPPAIPTVFWHRARSVKAQTKKETQSPFLLSRAVQMGNVRACRARGSQYHIPSFRPPSLPPAPDKALLGLSLIGNLDAIYLRSSYPFFYLHSVLTASRQRAGGVLLFQHTFRGRLWLNLCFDTNGFPEGSIEFFWHGLQDATEKFLL